MARWARTREILPSDQTHFTILIADLVGDDSALRQTRHVEAALRGHGGLEVMLIGAGPAPFERGSRMEALLRAERQGQELLRRHGGDVLVFGEVAKADERLHLRLLARADRGTASRGEGEHAGKAAGEQAVASTMAQGSYLLEAAALPGTSALTSTPCCSPGSAPRSPPRPSARAAISPSCCARSPPGCSA